MRQSPSNAPMAPEDETDTFHIEDVNLKRLTVADIVAGAASLVLLISLFLPWYTVSVPGVTSTLSGTEIHRFLWLAVLLSVVVLTYLIMHATVGLGSTPINKFGREPVLLSLSLVQLILVIVPFFDVPDTLIPHVSVGFAYGAYVGLVAAIAALVTVIVPFVRSLGPGR